MNVADLARIATTLVTAIPKAKARVRKFGSDPDFREIVRQAREMHDLLTESLIENEPLSTAHLRSLSDMTGNEIAQLETFVRMPDRKLTELRQAV
jgi:hypothetical protein